MPLRNVQLILMFLVEIDNHKKDIFIVLNDYHSEIEDYNEKIIKPTSVEIHPKFSRSKVVQHDLAIIRFLVRIISSKLANLRPLKSLSSFYTNYSQNRNSPDLWNQFVLIQSWIEKK